MMYSLLHFFSICARCLLAVVWDIPNFVSNVQVFASGRISTTAFSSSLSINDLWLRWSLSWKFRSSEMNIWNQRRTVWRLLQTSNTTNIAASQWPSFNLRRIMIGKWSVFIIALILYLKSMIIQTWKRSDNSLKWYVERVLKGSRLDQERISE